jgi:hypothetical protein
MKHTSRGKSIGGIAFNKNSVMPVAARENTEDLSALNQWNRIVTNIEDLGERARTN